ncbi:5060_t:CDS:2 [Scutellospora calospora]|uniref:5060_t:CDS:1 n=1 Tax=Scutellospora calospora TaxID=85575 RepID=A0ACA9KBV1_9GLOM|nr:5060_t:CDS:2 [Scutellospora calospora]
MTTTPPENISVSPVPSDNTFTSASNNTAKKKQIRAVEYIEDDILDLEEQINVLKKKAKEKLKERQLRKKLKHYEAKK